MFGHLHEQPSNCARAVASLGWCVRSGEPGRDARYTTLVRFDPVYHGHFKCNRRRIDDYPNLSNYLRDLYALPGVAGTVNLDQIKRHYYGSHAGINPTGIVPLGPELHFGAPNDRALRFGS